MAVENNIPILSKDVPKNISKTISKKEEKSTNFQNINKTLLEIEEFIGLKLDTQFVFNFKNQTKRDKIKDQFYKDTRIFYKSLTDNFDNLLNYLMNNNIDTYLKENSDTQKKTFDELNDTLKDFKTDDEETLEDYFEDLNSFFEEDKKDKKDRDKKTDKKSFLSDQTKQEANKNLEALSGPIGMIGSTIAKTLGKETFKDVFSDALDMFGSKDKSKKEGKTENKKNRSQEEILEDGFDKLDLLLTEEGLGADLDQIKDMVEAIMEDDEEKKKMAKESLKHTKNIDKKTQSDWLTQLISFTPMLAMLILNKGAGGLLKDLGGIGKGIAQAFVDEIPDFLDKLQKGIIDAIIEGIGKAFGFKEDTIDNIKGVSKTVVDVTQSFNPLNTVKQGGKALKSFMEGDISGGIENAAKTVPIIDAGFKIFDAATGKNKENPKKIKDGIIGRNGEFYEPSDNDVIIATNKDLHTENFGQMNQTIDGNYNEIMKESVNKQQETNDLLKKLNDIMEKKDMSNNIISPVTNNNVSQEIDFNSIRLLGV